MTCTEDSGRYEPLSHSCLRGTSNQHVFVIAYFINSKHSTFFRTTITRPVKGRKTRQDEQKAKTLYSLLFGYVLRLYTDSVCVRGLLNQLISSNKGGNKKRFTVVKYNA